ncbi:metal ABC transporter permease [Dechloromonas denitrificans]|uniref:metal ABC transporter permease n=1 Tax=Dechloromonas denitrificans TaxID=281362 RepID=UPI001CF7EE14|nr:metal ABC transporter permease [Dechloromonas denitrificans]UCV03924.1 metal ABC transporter permease [Dechloromonas denitrificans]UCV08180.1 metal ABC transporter permease [Dechloromonas denitrificans]
MWSDLFLVPFLTGLCLAIVLPLLGCYLRLRDEWLAALAYSHVAAAGALLALVIAMPPVLGGMAAAGLVGAGKRFFASKLAGGASYALLLLGGWAVAVLLAANHPLAERLGHALFDGQLYFSSSEQLWLVAGGSLIALAILRALAKHLLLAHVYPDFFRLRGLHAWPTQSGFDVLAALLLALATMSIGVMGAFALVFIPPWLAFRRAPNWRRGLLLAQVIGVLAYIAGFLLALGLDQPFGPVLALLLIGIGLVIA